MSDFIKLSEFGVVDPDNIHINIRNVTEVSDTGNNKCCRIYLCNGHTIDIPHLKSTEVVYIISVILK